MQVCRGPRAGLGQAAPTPPRAHSAAGAPAPPWCAQDPTAAEQLGSAGGRSRRPRELLGKGQAPGRGHQEPPYGPCALPRQLSLKITLGVQSPRADGRETGKSGKICFVSTPRLKLAERRRLLELRGGGSSRTGHSARPRQPQHQALAPRAPGTEAEQQRAPRLSPPVESPGRGVPACPVSNCPTGLAGLNPDSVLHTEKTHNARDGGFPQGW